MGYSYGYDYGYFGDEMIIEEMMAGFGFALLGVVAVFLLIALAVSIAWYVLSSIGFYSIAKRRGIRNAWLAWVPVANYWIVGSISDQYQYVVRGRQTNRRTVLLIAAIASTLVTIAVNVSRGALLITGAEEMAFANGVASALSVLAGLTVGIVLLVFYYMSMYDLYTSVSPRNNVLFLVLSILFRITEPFFVFFNRKSDAGMPPRRETENPFSVPDPAPEPYPWDGTEV